MMTGISPGDSRLKDLCLADFISYLKLQGWEEIQPINERSLLFAGPLDDFGRPIRLLLPRHPELVDAPLRLAEAVNLLAVIENRPPGEIVRQIRQSHEARVSEELNEFAA